MKMKTVYDKLPDLGRPHEHETALEQTSYRVRGYTGLPMFIPHSVTIFDHIYTCQLHFSQQVF